MSGVAHKLVLDVYRLTASLPADEKYGLVSQMRRAEELRYYLILSRDLGYTFPFESLAQEAERMLTALGRVVRG